MTVLKNGHARLHVRHLTRFDYSGPVVLTHNDTRITPMETGLQRVLDARIQVSPECPVGMHRDHFGNIVHHFNIATELEWLEITSEATVETTHAICCGPESEPDPRPYQQHWAEFLAWSAGVPELTEYSTVPHAHEIRMQMSEDEFEAALVDVATYFFNTFRYDPDVTHVHSSPRELFEHGGGVCQDMAHALIGVLRTAGIPARYVSGYIYDPLGDKEGVHLRGASASHAWVQAWHDHFGWVGVDPTNDKLVDWQYIRTAIGRDYFDVQPVRGLFLGDVQQHMHVEVKVSRV